MKALRRFLSMLLLCLLAPLPAYGEQVFLDVPEDHEHVLAIHYLEREGIVAGYEGGFYRPNQQVNRAEALKIILSGSAIEVPSTVGKGPFTDVVITDWFHPFVTYGNSLGIVGGNPDGSFAPGRKVSRAEFVKMLLEANGFSLGSWSTEARFSDVNEEHWHYGYMSYAEHLGIIRQEDDALAPNDYLTRSDVAAILYAMSIIRRKTETQFLLSEAERQMVQIEAYMKHESVLFAKRTAELSVNLMIQAMENLPDHKTVQSAYHIALAYDHLVTTFIAAVEGNIEVATRFGEKAKNEATSAWEADNSIQPVARYIKDRVDSIMAQL